MSEKQKQATIDEAVQDEAPRTPPVEVVEEREVQQALVEQKASQALIERLLVLENSQALLRRFMDNLHTLRLWAIQETEPQMWNIFRDADGNQFARPKEAACALMRKPYRITVELKPVNADGNFEPEVIDHGGQIKEYRGWATARSATLGPEHDLVDVPFSRYSDEDFTGRRLVQDSDGRVRVGKGRLRQGQKDVGPVPGDITSACASLGRSKTTRIMTGTAQVALSVLEEAWDGKNKRVADCVGASGFGTSQERTAGRVQEGSLKEEQEKLRKELLSRTGGDKEAARQLLKECSAFEGRNGLVQGVTQISKLASIGRIRGTWRSLREHEVFGDQHQDKDDG